MKISTGFIIICICLFAYNNQLFSYNAFIESGYPAPLRVPESYDRSSLSWLMVHKSGDQYRANLRQAFPGISHTEKFFLNPLPFNIIEYRGRRDENNVVISAEAIMNTMNENSFARYIISHWYSRTDDGKMDMDRIHRRGMENATDIDVLRHQATTRGNWALMDYGNRLINRSYIVAIDFYNVTRVDNEYYEGFNADIAASLFKINISDEDKELIYDSWVLDDDSSEEAARKVALYETLEPELEFITMIYTHVSSYNDKAGPLSRILPTKSTDQLFADIAQKAYDRVVFELERSYDDFKVVTPLFATRPPRAKIGKKEGLSVDQRFFVYEHVYDPSTRQVRERKRGVIRATSDIADNRQIATGETQPSTFYQVAGRRLQPGYVLLQRNDIGLELELGTNTGDFGGYGLVINYAVGRRIGVRSLYASLALAYEESDFHPAEGVVIDDHPALGAYNPDIRPSFARIEGGLAKGLHFFRHFELRPYGYYGIELGSYHEDREDLIKVHFIKTGGTLALNLYHSIQLFGGYHFNFFVSNAMDDDDNELELGYDEVFFSRSGHSPYFGIRFKF